MKPVAPVAKHISNGFSIDSLIKKDTRSNIIVSDARSSNDEPSPSASGLLTVVPPDPSGISGRIPPLHPALPSHVRNLLMGEQSHLNNNDLMALQRSAAWAFQNSLSQNIPFMGRNIGLTAGVGPTPTLPSLYPGLLGHSTGRDPSTVAGLYPWMVSRHPQNFFGLPYGRCISYIIQKFVFLKYRNTFLTLLKYRFTIFCVCSLFLPSFRKIYNTLLQLTINFIYEYDLLSFSRY